MDLKNAHKVSLGLTYNIYFLRTVVFLFFVSFVIFVTGAVMESAIIMLCAPAVFFLTPLLLAMKTVSNARELQASMIQSTKRVLKRVDYYNVTASSAIAVDVRDKVVSIINVTTGGVTVSPEPIVIKTSKITEVYWHKEGFATHKIYSAPTTVTGILMDAHAEMQLAEKNVGEVLNAIYGTGVYIEQDDIYQPKVFCRLDKGEIEHWALLLKKLCENTLEESPQPVSFPR